ncbi:MAG: HD domain-containing protein [Lachnospiraceae bacterium]|nr:HD domain-containing protein [Lachnospiraceae bacterium]
MYDLIKTYQMDIMLGLSSICVAVGFFALITKSLPRKRKLAMIDLEFSASILLFSDRIAYIFHGDPTVMGYWMVRISNFLVFFMTISVMHAFNLYICDLCSNEIGLKTVPFRLRLVELVAGAGWILVIISQFTGLYYYFDESNAYQRGPGFLICYIIPFVGTFIQLSVIIQYFKRLSLYISIPMLLFTILPIIASIFQALLYGVSLTNMSIVGLGIVLYIFAIMEMNDMVEKMRRSQLDEANRKSLHIRQSFEQVVKAVVKALDSRDRYTRGHSLRVAEYSKEIAQRMELDEKECFRVYYSAAMHDIGKIEIPDRILAKPGRLTDIEEEILKKHPAIGGAILAEVENVPYLATAARYHHERYDGKGYPEGTAGEDIPLIGRIVAVANAYDEMTSFKFSHTPFAQGRVRETLVNGAGHEFDPAIVKIMVEMIDHDTDYMMRESEDEEIDDADRNDITIVNRMHFENYKELVSDGIRVQKEFLKVRFETRPDTGYDRKNSIPAIVLFDSFDRCVHRNERNIKNLHYFEYGEIWMDGHTVTTSARDIKASVTQKVSAENIDENEWIAYEIEAVNIKDHVRIKINSKYMFADITVALPDSTRYVFFGLTGEHCTIKDISVKEIALGAGDDNIPRIVPEVSYFTRKDGDIPNVEVNGYREEATLGIPVDDGMRLFFRTQSLPVASLVQHCAYILLYSSDDGTVNGKNYTEYVCIRTDGDEATIDGKAKNKFNIHKAGDFSGWDAWKEKNKKGLDYEIVFKRRKNNITFKTENAGISIECATTVPKGADNVYVALTGNLCTLMDIRVR